MCWQTLFWCTHRPLTHTRLASAVAYTVYGMRVHVAPLSGAGDSAGRWLRCDGERENGQADEKTHCTARSLLCVLLPCCLSVAAVVSEAENS